MRKNHYTMKARNAVKNTLCNFHASDAIGVGCSGGADSSAILFALSTLYHGSKASNVHVIIIDHQLQEITAEVSKNVSELASKFGFVSHIVPVNVIKTVDGAESDARHARYNAFENIAQEFDLKAILIGHTKNDQAEQTFLGMLRGSGTRSLSGIPKVRDIYNRPFLDSLSREDTQKVCEENNYAYWCDPHNDYLMYKRVGIRKMIKTVEETTGVNVVDSLVKTSQISAEDADALDFYTDAAFDKIEKSEWSVHVISQFPASIRKRVFRKKLSKLGVSPDFDMTNRIDDLISDWHGQKEICFPHSVCVFRNRGKIVIK